MYLAFENRKVSSKKVNSGQEAKTKVWMMFLDVRM